MRDITFCSRIACPKVECPYHNNKADITENNWWADRYEEGFCPPEAKEIKNGKENG